jgi:hypothetical protein
MLHTYFQHSKSSCSHEMFFLTQFLQEKFYSTLQKKKKKKDPRRNLYTSQLTVNSPISRCTLSGNLIKYMKLTCQKFIKLT